MVAGKLDGNFMIFTVTPDIDDEIRRGEQRGGMEQRGDASRVHNHVFPGGLYFEAGQSGADDLLEGGVDCIQGDPAEGELEEMPPEAAPPAGEGAREGGGTGAAEANEDLEQQVIRKGADPILSAAVWAAAWPGPKGRSWWRLRAEAFARLQLHP